MTTRELAGILLLPIALIIAACSIHAYKLWSFLGNYVFGWFCSALALAILIIGTTCLLVQTSPNHLPLRVVICVVVSVMTILGIGLVLDFFAYPDPADWLSSIGELIGFGVILSGTFLLPRFHPLKAKA